MSDSDNEVWFFISLSKFPKAVQHKGKPAII